MHPIVITVIERESELKRMGNVIIIKVLNPQYWSQFKFNPPITTLFNNSEHENAMMKCATPAG